jgi:hypothetical protein
MTPADTQSLKDAIARGAPAVLSLRADGGLQHHRTRFLTVADDADGFWIEAPPDQRPLLDLIMNTKQPVGVSLKNGFTKVIFTTLVRDYEPALPAAGDGQPAVDAVFLVWPDQVQAIQRRTDYRVTVQPADGDVRLRVWRIPDHAHLRDKPPASTLLKVELGDLSVGGMGATYTPDPAPESPKVAVNQRLRVALSHGRAEELILEARVRHVRALPDQQFRLGVQFEKLKDDLDGRQTLAALTYIVGQLQRTEIRRKRLAMSRKSA